MIRYTPGAERWGEPLTMLRRMQDEVNRVFGEARFGHSPEFPPINIWRGEAGTLILAEIPGVRLEDIEVTVLQNTLTFKGRRDPEATETGFHRRERWHGPFARSISLPDVIDPERVVARAVAGILTIELPRPEADKPRRIVVNRID